MRNIPVFKCICNGILNKDETCQYWADKCNVAGYPDIERCKFWGPVYTMRNAIE